MRWVIFGACVLLYLMIGVGVTATIEGFAPKTERYREFMVIAWPMLIGAMLGQAYIDSVPPAP